jgi:NADPH:quinone reductase
VRACMTANVVLRFVLLYGVPMTALGQAAAGITATLAAGELSGLPVHAFPLAEIAAAHEAAEGGAVGKVIVIP